MKILTYIGLGLLVLLIFAIIFLGIRMLMFGKASREMEPSIGLVNGQLSLCPRSPNCVSSVDTDETHSVAEIEGDLAVFNLLADHLSGAEGPVIVSRTDTYVHATYQSRLFGFVDDLELFSDGDLIQVRSASRVGYSDLGVNRERVETLRSFVKEQLL